MLVLTSLYLLAKKVNMFFKTYSSKGKNEILLFAPYWKITSTFSQKIYIFTDGYDLQILKFSKKIVCEILHTYMSCKMQ